MQEKLQYIATSFDKTAAINTLLGQAYEPSQKVSSRARIRALNLIFKIGSAEEISLIQNLDEVK